MHTRAVESGMTILEAVVSTAVFAGILSLLAGMVASTSDATSVVGSTTTAQMEAERLLGMIRQELQPSGVSATGGLTVSPDGREVTYVRLDSRAPIFDPSDPLTPPWESQRRVIKLEADGAETLGNGADEDGDFLRDEGRVAVYIRPPSGPDQLIAVMARDVMDPQTVAPSRPMFSLDTATPLPRVTVVVDLERIIMAGARGSADVGQLQAGGGSRARHRAMTVVTLLN